MDNRFIKNNGIIKRLILKNQILQLRDTPFLAFDEQVNGLLWKSASSVFYMDDKPGYDILPAAIKAVVQPQFINRDKNRFGKIAALIGLALNKRLTRIW